MKSNYYYNIKIYYNFFSKKLKFIFFILILSKLNLINYFLYY